MSEYDSLYQGSAPARALTMARASAVLGILSMALCMFGCCSSQMSTCTAVPLSVVAIFLARSAAGITEGEARAYANVGVAGGTISLIYCLVVITAISLYLLLYVAIIGVSILGNL
jgi:hypothetical protein